MVKRILCCLLCFVILFSCCSCKDDSKVNKPTDSSIDEARWEERNKQDEIDGYKSTFVDITCWKVEYVKDSLGENKLGLTQLEIENRGGKDLDLVEIEIVFRNRDFEKVFTYEVAPINSIYDGTFYSGDIWTLDSGKYYIIENAPKDIELDYCTIYVKDIMFTDG